LSPDTSTGVVRHRTTNQSFSLAHVVHTLRPVTTQPSPSRSARVVSDARSLPLSGSLMPIEKERAPLQMPGRKRRFCASVP